MESVAGVVVDVAVVSLWGSEVDAVLTDALVDIEDGEIGGDVLLDCFDDSVGDAVLTSTREEIHKKLRGVFKLMY